MNKFNIANALVARGLALLSQPTTTSEPVLTDKQKKLVDFFKKSPFDCQRNNVAELVEILEGGFNPMKYVRTDNQRGFPVGTVVRSGTSLGVIVGFTAGQEDGKAQCSWAMCRPGQNSYIATGAGYNANRVAGDEAKRFLETVVTAWTDAEIVGFISSVIGSNVLPGLYKSLEQ